MNREEFDIGRSTATALYRIAQEALTNVARHAAAKSVKVRIEQADGIRLVVADDGRGMPQESRADSFGLLGMRERVQMLDGRLEVAAAEGGGTVVEVWLPQESLEGRQA